MEPKTSVDQYPKPPDYSVQGLHWTPTPYNSATDQARFMDIAQQMGIKWILLLDDGGGSSLEPNPYYAGESPVEMFLDRGMMPIIRFLEPCTHRFSMRNEDALARLSVVYAAEGYRGIYFFWQNECEQVREWDPLRVPRNWLYLVWRNFVMGAYKAQSLNQKLITDNKVPSDFRICTGTPALTSAILLDQDGERVNPFRDYMSEQERTDIFIDGYGWANIHNYPLNHPVDYPDDDVNKMARPLTHEEYMAKLNEVDEKYRQTVRPWVWEPWETSEYHINLLRRQGVNPNASLETDDACFRVYEGVENLLQQADDRVDLRDYVALGSSETGPVVDDRQDGRYARTTPQYQVATWDAMVNVASQVKNYLFLCLWLVGVAELGIYTADSYEGQGLFTHRHDDPFLLKGVMPLVQHLIDKKEQKPADQPATSDVDSMEPSTIE